MPGGGSRNVPVDGGLGWLAAAGAAYAIRKLQQTYGDTSQDDERSAGS